MSFSNSLFLVAFVLTGTLLLPGSAISQNDEMGMARPEDSPWLETIEIRNVRYLLPKGTKFRKRAGVITFEGPGEYSARRLTELEQRLRESERKLRGLQRALRLKGGGNP